MMQQSDSEVDFSKVSSQNTNLTIYTDIANNKQSSGSRFQAKMSLGPKITPKSVVESVSGKLKSLIVSDSLRHQQRNQRRLHECDKSHHNISSIKKPVYAANKFETQDISASQLLEAIDNAEELHNVATKGYTQEFEISFQVENIKVSDVNELEKGDALNNPDSVKSGISKELEPSQTVFVKSDVSNELELSQNSNNLSLSQTETKSADNVPFISTDMEPNNIAVETLSNDTQNINLCDKNIEIISSSNDINKVQIEQHCKRNNKLISDIKILDETYCISKECILNLDEENVVDTENNKSQIRKIQNKLLISEITSSPIFSLVTRQETVISPHIVCNLDDFEKFEQLAVSFKESLPDKKGKHVFPSQILGEYFGGVSDNGNDDILGSSNYLSECDKAQLEDIININDNSNDLNMSPVLPIQSIKVKFDTEIETLQSLSDMELTCKDTAVNIINNQDLKHSYLETDPKDVKEVILKQTDDDFLEDDILFSSDEEDEYIHKELNELPLTCALETSFYTNQSDVLDKTMFVGFQTASNKYISISTDSFCKAKSMIDDIDSNLGPSLLELVDKCEKSAIENNSLDDDADKTSQTTKACINETINNTDTKNGLKSNCNFIGFKTASNKSINLSEKSRQRILQVFQDIDLTDDFTKKECVGNEAILDIELISTENNESSKDNTNACNPNNLFTEIEFTDTEMNAFDEGENLIDMPDSNIYQTTFEGFKTASNKAISISEHALHVSKKVFENIDSNKDDAKVILNSITKKTVDDHVFKKPESPISKPKNFVAFQTASNKLVDVSNNALKVGIKMFDDINADTTANEIPQLHNNDKQDNVKFCGFKTASNKKVSISEKALKQSNKLFQDLDKDSNQSTKQDEPSSVSFKTANNKPIQISKETIEKCRKVFENIDNLDEIIPQTSNQIRNSKHAESLDQKGSRKTANDSAEETKFVGFQTASNKRISISKQSLQKTKHIFGEVNELELKTHDVHSKNIAVPYGDTLISKTDNLSNKTPNFIGFQTANNKKINISKQLLEKTKHIFSNIDDIETDDIKNKYSSEGIIQEMKISSNKKKNVSNNSNDTQVNKEIKEKSVNNKENYKLVHENSERESKRHFEGFQTANNKKVKVSNEALAKTKHLFNDLINYSEQNEGNTVDVEFKGFQTASNKNIVISKDALAKTEDIFQDLPDDLEKILKRGSVTLKFGGFQTGNKETISVSEEALKSSKRTFDDIEDEEFVNQSNKANEKPSKSFAFCFQNANETEIQVSQKAVNEIRKDSKQETPKKVAVNDTISLLDTQALSNFENTLLTEDFCKETTLIQPKRSGSPILSCPKAKKRKSFQTPYKTEKVVKPPKVKDIVKEAANLAYEFNSYYKKNKTITLKMLQKLEKDSKNTSRIDIKISEINFENILNFKFEEERNDVLGLKSEGVTFLTVEDLKTLFLESIDKKIIPEGWIENHLNLIMWKLLSYEVKFPKILNKVCTAKNVMEQLKYRYDKELYNVERPALRKILEKDELASKCIILCVVNIIQDGSIVESITDINKTTELTVTDGWYCVKASIDKMLTKLVYDGKIVVGCKIITHGAELINCEQGKSPLEDISDVRLKIFGNSTRLVRWHTKLGFFAAAAILNRLSNVKVNGGKISKLRLFVTRVYPMLYVEKFEDGSTVTRSERLEQRCQNKYEMERQNLMEKLYEEIERELSDEDSQDSIDYKEPYSKTKCLESGSQIARAMKRCKDPAEFRSNLTENQVQLLNEYTNKHRDRILQQIQTKIRQKMEKSGSNCIRNVVPLLKVRVADVQERNGSIDVCQGYISIWRPNEAVSEMINEGEWIGVLNALPTSFRSQEIQLTAGRQTVFSKITPKLNERTSLHTKQLLRQCKEIKDLVKNPNENIEYNEIDTIGVVTEIDPPNSNFEISGRQFQNVYLADLEKNIICINFWGGIKKFGFENILDTGHFVYGRNLQKRVGNTRKSIPQFRVTEFSVFTKTPKNIIQRKLIDNFVQIFSKINIKQFCDDCCLVRRNYENNKYNFNTENISPFRMNNSDYNLSKNRQYFESPLAHNRKEDDFRLTGLDFESTFKQTDTQNMSPELLKKKHLAQAKIAKLKMYGEPPPLSPMHILNKSKNATAAFKSPLVKDPNKSIPTAIPKTTNEFLPLVENRSSSPVFSFNATYTKKVINPVKLNFNVNDCVNGSVDHFEGDFDGSPPLSLD